MKKLNLVILAWFAGITLFACMMTSCKSTYQHCDAYGQVKWEDSIDNPDNEEFVVETAFQLTNGHTEDVTQEMFNSRYGIK